MKFAETVAFFDMHASTTPSNAIEPSAMQSTANMVAIELLDSSQSQPMQTWEFSNTAMIRLGRASDNDVVLGSPYVSRAHAYLRWINGEWELCSLSQQGIFIGGRRVESMPLREGIVFQLSAKGPFLRFSTAGAADSEIRSTVAIDAAATPILILDAGERDRQVDEIAGGAYFRHLQNMARQLRDKHDTRI